MISKGDAVKVKRYTRTQTIFQNAEVNPGIATTFEGGWTGIDE